MSKDNQYPHIVTGEDYAKYEQAVSRFLHDNNALPGLHGPSKESREYGDPQPYFSWRPCGCCNRSLGGNRSDYEFVRANDDVFEAAICDDCVYYLKCGRLDDLTMFEILKERCEQVTT